MKQWGRTLLLAAMAAVGAAFTPDVAAQEYDTASVPFLVNVDATVSATDGVTHAQIPVTANQEAVLHIPLQKTDAVRFFGTQRRANAPAIISNRNGKVAVNLPAQSHKNAEVLLYTVNGKRILRTNMSASNTANSISRPNLATGVYLLSVRGVGGNAITSRLTHSGGGLSISVIFGGEDVYTSADKRLTKSAATGDWTITVGAAGYVDSTYTLRPAAGANARQNITLRAVPDGEYTVTVSAGIGASGGGSYAPGTKVSIDAGEAPFGHKFNGWTTESSGVILVSAASAATTFIMPANAVTVKANFEAVPTYAVTVSSAGTGASGNGSYVDGATVAITAGTAPAGQRFKNWTTESGGVVFADANSAATTFTMPKNAVTVTANFQANTYKVTVSAGAGATGGGDYSPGTAVNITAGAAPTGYNEFKYWASSNEDVVFADANGAATTFIMLSEEVTVTAVFVRSDSKTYKTVTIGSQTWMAENLNYAISIGSWCYENKESNCDIYGRLYDWETAMTVCPTGWHLPSRQEWTDLVMTVGGYDVAGKKLKATSGWNGNGNGTDEFGFFALPGGESPYDDFFSNVGNSGSWWTSREVEGGYADILKLHHNYDGVDGGYSSHKPNRLSVRCVQN